MTISERDQANVWHPFTQHQNSEVPLAIKRGEGAYLFDEKGNRYLDLISSWWVNIHGHGHPAIAQAIYQQALTLEHVIFSGFTHEPAVFLAEKLLNLLPSTFSKVFYSDNGSTAVEIALKMAYQYWRNQGHHKRRRFIAFENGYHGDTFGAMSVGKKSGFFSQFEDLLFEVDTFPYPSTWINDDEVECKEQQILKNISEHLDQYGSETAALIIEPLVQGASGMKMCRPSFLRELEQIVREHGVLIIYDEVMTGFGRTGDLFACKKSNTTPDIICLAKGLTGGFLPLAVTACSERIYQSFLGDNFTKALAHGHSYTANPLGCAAALASTDLLIQPETLKKIATIEFTHSKILNEMSSNLAIHKLRFCGTIAAFDLKLASDYGSETSLKLRQLFLDNGLIIRPLGNTIYILPPYCITAQELKSAYKIVTHELQGVFA